MLKLFCFECYFLSLQGIWNKKKLSEQTKKSLLGAVIQAINSFPILILKVLEDMFRVRLKMALSGHTTAPYKQTLPPGFLEYHYELQVKLPPAYYDRMKWSKFHLSVHQNRFSEVKQYKKFSNTEIVSCKSIHQCLFIDVKKIK